MCLLVHSVFFLVEAEDVVTTRKKMDANRGKDVPGRSRQ